jgi:hypothetical protein
MNSLLSILPSAALIAGSCQSLIHEINSSSGLLQVSKSIWDLCFRCKDIISVGLLIFSPDVGVLSILCFMVIFLKLLFTRFQALFVCMA